MKTMTTLCGSFLIATTAFSAVSPAPLPPAKQDAADAKKQFVADFTFTGPKTASRP